MCQPSSNRKMMTLSLAAIPTRSLAMVHSQLSRMGLPAKNALHATKNFRRLSQQHLLMQLLCVPTKYGTRLLQNIGHAPCRWLASCVRPPRLATAPWRKWASERLVSSNALTASKSSTLKRPSSATGRASMAQTACHWSRRESISASSMPILRRMSKWNACRSRFASRKLLLPSCMRCKRRRRRSGRWPMGTDAPFGNHPAKDALIARRFSGICTSSTLLHCRISHDATLSCWMHR